MVQDTMIEVLREEDREMERQEGDRFLWVTDPIAFEILRTRWAKEDSLLS